MLYLYIFNNEFQVYIIYTISILLILFGLFVIISKNFFYYNNNLFKN